MAKLALCIRTWELRKFGCKSSQPATRIFTSPVPALSHFERVLEIVPQSTAEKQAMLFFGRSDWWNCSTGFFPHGMKAAQVPCHKIAWPPRMDLETFKVLWKQLEVRWCMIAKWKRQPPLPQMNRSGDNDTLSAPWSCCFRWRSRHTDLNYRCQWTLQAIQKSI